MATSRKLIAALTASLVGISRTLQQMQEDEEFENEQRRRDAADVRADEYLDIQRGYQEDSRAQRAEAERQRVRSEANTENQRGVDDAALLADARGYRNVEMGPAVNIPSAAGQTASTTIPLATGDDRIDLDLQQIFSRHRPGGDVATPQDMAAESNMRRAFLGSVREAGIGQDISRENRIESETRPEKLETARQRALLERSINPPSGGAPRDVLSGGRDEEILGVAIGKAEEGKMKAVIAQELVREYPDVPPGRLMLIAADAENEYLKMAFPDEEERGEAFRGRRRPQPNNAARMFLPGGPDTTGVDALLGN